MTRYSDDDQRVIESDQQKDTFLTMMIDDQVRLRLCSVRSQESQLENLPNQDFVRVVSRPGKASLSFCVCDGVGGSYQGNFAARYLAMRLTSRLQSLPAFPSDLHRIATSLHKELASWAADAQQELLCRTLPSSLVGLEREIIEEQRDHYGSATVFFGGRIDYALDEGSPAGATDTMQTLFCWMGNITALAYIESRDYQRLGDWQNDRNRWSTLRGLQGDFTTYITTLSRTDPLIIHTDGLEKLSDELAMLNESQLQERIQQLLQQPTSDDMTFLELCWFNDE
jgi:hypothetical protein